MNWKELAHSTILKMGSQRKAAKALGIPRSTLGDFIRGNEIVVPKILTSKSSVGPTILYIPDCQVRPGIDLTYLRCIGEYIALKRPDVIVCGGDFADMPSLSSYVKGKRKAEGKRIHEDLKSVHEGMRELLTPLARVQQKQLADREKVWKPRMVLTQGNHEQRIIRHTEANPELHGFLGYENLKYEEAGWEVYDFLEPVEIEGVTFIHYYPNNMTGKPLGGAAANILQKVGMSVVQGHRQVLDVATRTLHDGSQQWAIVAGACYLHEWDYKGYTGNKHWRGLIVMHNIKNGGFDPLFVNLQYIVDSFNQ